MNLRQLDKKYFGRRDEPEDVVVGDSAGSDLTDSRGRRYIDFMMGWCVGNLGWGNTEIRAAARKFDGPEYVHPNYLYRPWAELAEMLARMTPGDLTVSYRTTGGTESVEAALQIAMAYTGRGAFVSIEHSYHGNSIGTMSIGASDNRETFKSLLPNCHKIEPPLDGKALGKVETLLKKRDVAAFIMEPIICNLGAVVPDDEFVRGVRKLCTRYGTLFIADEVATGFGRTGKLFACEHFDLEPDVLCMAKAITGGYGGMGAVITTSKIAKAIKGDFSLYSTYGWHPRAVAVALTNLRYLMRHRSKLLKNATELGEHFLARLSQMRFHGKATVRGKGLAIGIELQDEDYAAEIGDACRKNGLLISAEENVLMLFPALTIDRATAERGLDIFEGAL
ncbi:MAG TPA: aspartate aminotransferase family protein [Nevskiaceae bacterium]|nr:aspartate aminotransferase family protein [Nevskiaceae bacterium]